jgi:3-keto-5-aminohexanoate cleavage enzyme
MGDDLIIMVAPSIPAVVARDLPALDLSPEGIAREVVRAWNAGASIVHLHVWDERGLPSSEASAFERTVQLIRAQCDIIIEGSTGGTHDSSLEGRSVALQTDVEMATLNTGTVNWGDTVYRNSPDDIAYWAQEMQRRGIRPDLAAFEIGMVANSLELVAKGWVEPPLFYTFILGQAGVMPATARNLLHLSEALPPGATWSAAGHGGHDLRVAAMAITMGGHARVGFEDNPYYRPGEPATSNAQLVERVVRIGREVGRTIASPAEVRAKLGVARCGRATVPDVSQA